MRHTFAQGGSRDRATASFHTHRFRWVDHEPGAGYKPDVSTHLLQRSGAEPAETLRLSRDLVRSLRRGHAWVFADALRGPPRGTPGGIARLLDAGGRAVLVLLPNVPQTRQRAERAFRGEDLQFGPNIGASGRADPAR